MANLPDQHILLFSSLFRGRSDAYARRWEKDGRSGYAPSYDFNWDEFMAHKRMGGTLKDFKQKRLLPLTNDVIRKHLLGTHAIGIYPILPENRTFFLAADFDGDEWKGDAVKFIAECGRHGLTSYVERSRSGNGGHVWLFFSEAYPCQKSRRIGLELIRRAFHISAFEKEVSFDRLFPNQDFVPKDGFGNLIALPLQGTSVMGGNTAFLDLHSWEPAANQWEFLASVRRHSPQELDGVLQNIEIPLQPDMAAGPGVQSPVAIHVGSRLLMARSQLTPALTQFLRDQLNFMNTEYLTKRRLGKSVYQVQKYFKLIDEEGGDVLLPRGFLNELTVFLRDQGVEYAVHRNHSVQGEVQFKSLITLSPAQSTAVRSALSSEEGIIVAPAGSGKTIIGLELIARRGLPALILVHRRQIMDQWLERIQSFLGIPKAHIGEYSGVRKRAGPEITVGLLQSLARLHDLEELKHRFGTVVVDECHHIPASTFRKIVGELNPRFLYGLTATPKRKHNDERLIFLFIGGVVAQIEAGDVAETEPTQGRSLEVLVRRTSLTVPFSYSTDVFQLLAKIVCFDSTRNQLIVEDIIREAKREKKVLVLTERKEHLEILNLYLKGKCETIVVSGDDSAAARKSKFRQIDDGHYQVILSTGQFFGEGIDIRGITSLIFAFPFSFEGKLMQYVGRLRDIASERRVIDYRDMLIPFLEKQFKQRERMYKKLSARIHEREGLELDLPF